MKLVKFSHGGASRVRLEAPIARRPAFLVAGDVVRIQIGNVGEIENPVIDEPGTGDE